MTHNKILVSVMVSLAMLAPLATAAEKEIQIEGSTTVGPIADAFVEAFKTIAPNTKISVKKTGSGDGARALVDGTCQIASMSRFMKPKEFKKAVDNGIAPVAHVVAMDGVCIIVNNANPVKQLTMQQLRDIYTGKITNWKQVGGADKPIVAYTRDSSSGTYETFHKLAMNKQKMGPKVQTVSSNPAAKANVEKNPSGIAYVGLGFTKDGKVKKLVIDGVEPTQKTIASGKYPISRPLYLFTNGYPKLGSVVHAFCTFYLTPEGQDIIEKKGFVPVTSY